MSEEKVLTKEIAEQFLADYLADEDSVDLSEFTTIEEAAAETLSKHPFDSLCLDGLTELSDAAAESFGNFDGSWIQFSGLTSISDAGAKSLTNIGAEYIGLYTSEVPASAGKILRDAGIENP